MLPIGKWTANLHSPVDSGDSFAFTQNTIKCPIRYVACLRLLCDPALPSYDNEAYENIMAPFMAQPHFEEHATTCQVEEPRQLCLDYEESGFM